MYKHLISEQRYAIYLMLQKNMFQKDIAAAIGVSPSTITRELKRNSSRRKYNWNTAQSNATYHKHRHPGNHAVKAGIKIEVISLLITKQWSPRQISGRLALEGRYISHETIYKDDTKKN
uniref:transposase n=1 Tax=Prevotella sp. TaxID=59823 RepID=UPI0040260012